MGRHLLLSLVILSSLLGFLQALICFECDQINASGICVSEESFCQTQGSQQCYVRKVYEDDTISHGYQGCSSICIDMWLFSHHVAVDLKCCHDSSFCNKF